MEVSQAAGAFRLQLTDDFTPAPEYVTWLRKRVETYHGGSGGNKEEAEARMNRQLLLSLKALKERFAVEEVRFAAEEKYEGVAALLFLYY